MLGISFDILFKHILRHCSQTLLLHASSRLLLLASIPPGRGPKVSQGISHRVNICIHINLYVYTCIYIHIYIYIYIFMYESLGAAGSTTSGLQMVSSFTNWPLRRRECTAFSSLAKVTKAVRHLPQWYLPPVLYSWMCMLFGSTPGTC